MVETAERKKLDVILKKDGFQAIIFSSRDCSVCTKVIKFFEKIASYYKDVPYSVMVNGEDFGSDIMDKYSFTHVPTVILFKDGRIIDSITGYKKDCVNMYLKRVISSKIL